MSHQCSVHWLAVYYCACFRCVGAELEALTQAQDPKHHQERAAVNYARQRIQVFFYLLTFICWFLLSPPPCRVHQHCRQDPRDQHLGFQSLLSHAMKFFWSPPRRVHQHCRPGLRDQHLGFQSLLSHAMKFFWSPPRRVHQHCRPGLRDQHLGFQSLLSHAMNVSMIAHY